MKKYILIRENSQYSYPYFILGIYDDKEDASSAKNKYISMDDKYKDQLYKKVNLVFDVKIKEIDVHGEEKEIIYFLIERVSMMGQVMDDYPYIGTDIEYLENIEEEISRKEENAMCCYCTLELKKNHNYFNSNELFLYENY